jgi:SET domain-containing protein
MANPRKCYRIGRSKTGLGLFATAPIAKGALIVGYSGPRIPTREAREREAKTGCRFMFEINNRWTVDGSTRRNIGRYANHACRPNAESALVKGKVVLRAIKAIGPGEEITYDYGREYFELFIKPKGCRCAKCLEAPMRGTTSDRSRAGPRRSRGCSNRTSAPSGQNRPGAKGRPQG